MALHPEIVTIVDLEHTERVTMAMANFTARGRGWINIEPELPPDVAPSDRAPLTRYFRRNSPEVALGTWMPPIERDDSPQQVGLQHALGVRIAPYLEKWNLVLPEGWRRVQDSPRRGLLLAVPADTAHDEVLSWLLRAIVAATRKETTGRWTATIYEGRT